MISLIQRLGYGGCSPHNILRGRARGTTQTKHIKNQSASDRKCRSRGKSTTCCRSRMTTAVEELGSSSSIPSHRIFFNIPKRRVGPGGEDGRVGAGKGGVGRLEILMGGRVRHFSRRRERHARRNGIARINNKRSEERGRARSESAAIDERCRRTIAKSGVERAGRTREAPSCRLKPCRFVWRPEPPCLPASRRLRPAVGYHWQLITTHTPLRPYYPL